MMKPSLSAIVAMTRGEQVMGKDNDLPWRIPGDLKFFKATTLENRIIMGRKTFESLRSKALPKRDNWVLSSGRTSKDYEDVPENLRFFKTKEEILSALGEISDGRKNFIIGGAAVFDLFWKEISEIFVTWIEEPFEGDIKFPNVNWNEFDLISERRELDPIVHDFCQYVRKS